MTQEYEQGLSSQNAIYIVCPDGSIIKLEEEYLSMEYLPKAEEEPSISSVIILHSTAVGGEFD